MTRTGTGASEPVPLGEFIRQRHDDIVRAWLDGVRSMPIARELDHPTLIDHIPAILERIAVIADELGSGQVAQLPKDVAEIHALERLGEGFDLVQVVAEFNVLRDCITRLWEERAVAQSHVLEVRTLNHAMDRAVTASIDRYTKARDRTLQALDQIADAALETQSLDDFLPRLLKVLVDTTAAVDVAVILLNEGETLRVRAQVGLQDDDAGPQLVRIGEGFAGKIAETGQPMELKDGATKTTVVRPALRRANLRTLFGVPLTGGGGILAVAHIGSRTAPEFSKQDKRLLVAMAHRATAAIYQHVLRDQARRAMDELTEREAHLRAIADNIPQLAWIADETGSTYWFNRRWFDFTGTALDEVTGWGWQKALHPDHAERVVAKLRQSFAAAEPWEDTFPLLGREGRYRWFLSRAVPIFDDAGTLLRWFGTNTDITEQRFLDEATKVLNSSLDYHATLEQVARLAVPDVADWCIVDLVEPTGTPRRVAIAHADATKTEPVSEKASIVAPLVARGQTLGAITLITAESGRRYHAADVALANELGRRAGTAVDNARLYAESQEALRMREDALRMREEVLAIVSHDLRNPLGAIAMGASNLIMEHGSNVRSRKQLDIIHRSTGRMERMISDLLDMATIRAKGLTLTIAAEDPQAIIQGVVEAHEETAAKRGMKIVTDVELASVRLWCDRERIEQLLDNLLGNAIKYCRPGDVIHVRGSVVGGEARFSITDTGPGVSAAEMPHLFQPYWSAKRSETKKGTGLGLYIAKGIVDAHRGKIWVESRVNEGTTFFFSLPLAP